jgi:Flp pilus assembly protein TadG
MRILRKNMRTALRDDREGAVAIEFALWLTLFFLVALSAFDLADLYFKRSQMGAAVSAASLQAFDQRDNVKFHELSSYVKALANKNDLSVTISCNGVEDSCTNMGRTCACLTTAGAFAARTCGTPCSGSNQTAGVNAGYYLTITASQPFAPAILPQQMVGSQLSTTATVRLQ